MTDARAAFLKRVKASREAGASLPRLEPSRSSARRDTAENVPAPTPVSASALRECFVREATAVEAQVWTVDSESAGRERVLAILKDLGAERVVRASTALLEVLALDSELSARGVAVCACDLRLADATRPGLRAEVCAADVGVSEADYAIAETGTLVFWHRPGQGRALSLLPPVHIAVLRERDLVANLSILFARLDAEGRPLASALTFVTGPSRTADIEMVITRGVHGPGALYLVLIAESEGEA